jgi:hypothetical protein
LTCSAGILLGWLIARAIHYDAMVSVVGLGASIVIQVAILSALGRFGFRFARGDALAASDLA